MEKFEISIGARKGRDSISSVELAGFLNGFNFYYEAAHLYLYEKGEDHLYNNVNLQKFKRFLRNENLYRHPADSVRPSFEPLEFVSISKNSPLKFIGYCSGASLLALSLAVAIAGGEADLQNKSFKVQPLSEAIIKMHDQLIRSRNYED